MLPKRVLYYGKDEPLPERIALRAGPVTLFYEGGDLRYLKLGDCEILRRIYVAIRDRNWGTVLPKFSNLQMEIGEDSFRITYDVENKQNEIDFVWHGSVIGYANGTVTFTMDGRARSTFMKNRIGFCVLHPSTIAGAACVVEHVDGTTEHATLPEIISSAQPVVPFGDMAALTHQVMPGVWAEVRFSGDIFEMEDQRNWTDASYKTFCTPLRIPYPAEIRAGSQVVQSVTMRLKDDRPKAESQAKKVQASPLTLSLDLNAPAVPLPPLGLGAASHDQPLTARELQRLQGLGLYHLRVDLTLSDPHYPERLERVSAETKALGTPLEIALLLSTNAQAELKGLEKVLAKVRPNVATWLVYPVKEIFAGGSPTAQVVELARQALASYAPNTRLAAGTNTDLIFMMRTPPPFAQLDAVTFQICPQVHAFDNMSVVETLAAQGVAVNTAKQFARGLPVMVSPVTLKMRVNTYATGAIPPTPPGELPPQVDPRQMSLLGAGWTVGSIKYLSESGASSVTYYETTGWRGIMETEAGSSVPDKFRSLAGTVFPVYHVFADVGEFANGEVIVSKSSDALALDGLALHKAGRLRVLVANLTNDPQICTVHKLGPEARVRVLDETNVVEAMRAPEEFRAQPGERRGTEAGTLELVLLPYALARIDSEIQV